MIHPEIYVIFESQYIKKNMQSGNKHRKGQKIKACVNEDSFNLQLMREYRAILL